MFGTIGWIVAGLIVSFQGWDAKIQLFYLAAGSALVMGLYCFTLPHTPPPSAGKRTSTREIFGLDALVLLKNRSFLAFMASSFLICIPLAFYYQMAAKFVGHTGQANVAFKMSLGQMSEIFFMLVMPLFFARLGVKWMLLVGMLAWVARYALFALGADQGVTWMVLGGILLHGICYDFFFVTGQIYTDKVAPAEIRSQAQGMLVLFTLGLGMLIGAQVAGRVEEHFTSAKADQLVAKADELEKQIEELEASRPATDADSLTPAERKEQVSALRKERSQISLQSVDWKSVWGIPAVGAGIIMILFALVFKDDESSYVSKDGASAS